MNLITLAEGGFLPDSLVRLGIRRLLGQRIRSLPRDAGASSNEGSGDLARFVEELRQSPLAIETDAANTQHYEVPADFFCRVLGPRLKYSSCYFEDGNESLGDAEIAMLRLTGRRAEIANGMRILELGCGWGSLTLWLAEQFPGCHITAISNSHSQREFIEGRAADRKLSNVRVITADMRDFATDERFDRIVSVEMFEHMRNYAMLFQRLSRWLADDGKAFVHVFCHRNAPYLFDTEGASNWMGRHFFTGGMMPAEYLFNEFDEHLAVEQQWRVNGRHYWKTCEHWLKNLDSHRSAILDRFESDLSRREAKLAVQRWRMFFMACAELFRYRNGDEWFVAHYRFRKQSQAVADHAIAAESTDIGSDESRLCNV